MPAEVEHQTAPGTWLVIAGGGTGGHVIPGLVVADELAGRGHHPTTIHWMGSEIGMEVEAVPAAGYQLTALPGRGLNSRRLDLANLKAALGIVRASVRGVGEVRRRRPSVLLALGGYASVAGVIGAVLWRVPIVVAEQNARGSLANRLAGRFAAACAVPFPGSDLPKAVVTGNPVRADIVEAAAVAADPTARRALRQELGVDDHKLLVGAMSGSLGARSVNRAIIDMVEQLAHREDVAVRHVVGRRDWGTEHAPHPDLDSDAAITYQAVDYEEQPHRLMAAADLFIGRAGGSTVAELAVVGVPSILVPLPIAPRDVQRHNAEALAGPGAAVVIADGECTGERLSELVVEFAADRGRLGAMASAALTVGHPDAGALVADLVEQHARD
jgi:UDP-N-acetylglucosamine--N-acetylmuramyl-(pentapeptide) pyrophosphoryl-undecaprenol N-acetylglucosamine transferase